MRRILVFSLVLALSSSGCAALRRFLSEVVQKPTVHFVGARVRSLSFLGAGLDLSWRIENPNTFGLKLASLSYTFKVNGKPLATGSTKKHLEVAPTETSTLTLPFDFRFADAANILLNFYRKEEVGWRVQGAFGFETPAGVLEIPYDQKGTVPVPRLPKVELLGLQARGVSIRGADLVVSLALRNANRFPLPASTLDWSLTLAGQSVGRGTLSPGTVPAGEARRIEVPVRIDFARTGQALYDALRSGQVEVGLAGTLTAGPVSLPLNAHRTLPIQ
ncbi:MAG: hypothetical protein D6729_03295 [Deltaproteobacteria bacterium]|nr:MAG: hypothetical protein D6729_03295 [Deltaproteobacteria bacterium]